MSVAFIVNPTSGKGIATFNRFKPKLTIPYRTYITGYQGHATKIVKYLVKEEKVTLVIVVGGDGTIHEVLNGLDHEKMTLGVIKNGSGNDFSRYFKTFQKPEEIEHFMRQPKRTPVDMLKVKHGSFNRYMINNGGIGFDAFVCEYVNQSKVKKHLNKLRLGKLVYPLFVCKALKVFKPFSVTVTIDGETTLYERVWFITLSNQPYFGGGMNIAPKAKATDRLLDVTIVHGLDIKGVFKLFWQVYRGTHKKSPYVSQCQVHHVTVKLADRMVCHSDGETYYLNGHFPIDYSVSPQKLRLAKPRQKK